MDLYVVRFVRKDLQPNEEYYYPSLDPAEDHIKMFIDDDSGLYDKIELVEYESEKVIKEMRFNV